VEVVDMEEEEEAIIQDTDPTEEAITPALVPVEE